MSALAASQGQHANDTSTRSLLCGASYTPAAVPTSEQASEGQRGARVVVVQCCAEVLPFVEVCRGFWLKPERLLVLGDGAMHTVTILKIKMDAPTCPQHCMSLRAPELLANFQASMGTALGKRG